MKFLLLFVVFWPLAGFAAINPQSSTSGLSREALLAELTGKDLSRLDDVGLYSEIISAYEARRLKQVESLVTRMLERYPRSPFADNALFLSGRVFLEEKNYAAALRRFQRVIDSYPKSNRVPAAKLAKAQAYTMMDLPSEARKVLRDVMAKFPGSAEAFRAEHELKLLR
ncbi:MAG: tetratricopeptide repeat protein [Bdellovibrionaceae bacterium]|nr:tetratricopeptide repeat protein [Pseudobdellovibrionaceae bacterium]